VLAQALLEALTQGAIVSVIQEPCSICGKSFQVTFRYQMEERGGGFVYFCSQQCLGRSHDDGMDQGDGVASCHACAKRFKLRLASQVFYTPGGERRYACTMPCRVQLIRESKGARLGEIAASSDSLLSETPRPSLAHPLPQRRSVDGASEPPRERVGRSRISEVSPITTKQPERSSAARLPRVPRRIAVFNHKGGTGKTTTSVNLAAGLAARGHRVLLVDTDSQGNVAVSLGASCDRTLYHVLVMGLRGADACQRLRPGLDLLASNETLAAAELYLAGRQNRDRVLSQRMAPIADSYDFVVVDCSPSLSLMNQNALVFADGVLVPVACDYLSLVGVRQVIKTVKNVNSLLRHRLQIWGVLPTLYDARAKICREALGTLKSHFAERCLTPIRATTKLKEAPAQASSIFEHAPGTHGAEDYSALVDAFVGRSTDNTSASPPALASGA